MSDKQPATRVLTPNADSSAGAEKNPRAAISHDRRVLRELARQVADIAALPVHQQTIALWKALNGLKPLRPMVMIDQIPWHEMNVSDELTNRCHDPFCKRLETQLRRTIYCWTHMRADMVVEPVVEVDKVICDTGFGVGVQENSAFTDPENDVYSHLYLDQLPEESDQEKIKDPKVWLDAPATALAEQRAHETFDGILEVRMRGRTPNCHPWDWIVCWRGAQNVVLDLADRPDYMHKLIARVVKGQLGLLDQMEAQGLLQWPQRLIHCTGAWADELPAPGFDPARPRACDSWTFGMSQIFSTVSPAMHEEFERPYLAPWFERFGLVYYGCCEPLDQKLRMIRKLPRVRKVSMSPWVDVERGAQNIGRDFVFSRKPNPALLAVDTFDPDAVEAHLRETIDHCAHYGCPLELIFKDISTARREPQRLWQCSEIARRLIGA